MTQSPSSISSFDSMKFLSDELQELKKTGQYRKLRILETSQEAVSVIDGRRVINLSSNNYLGLATHPKLIETANAYTKQYGVGTAAVRTIIGTQKIHQELENRLARFKGTEAAVVFQSGFTTNIAVVQSVLTDEKDILISDELNHASIIDGGRLSRAKRFVYPHKDIIALDAILTANAPGSHRRMIVTDGVFSMDGDIAPLPQIVEVAKRHGAMLMVDDAHASGVMGPNGRGTPSHFGLTDQIPIQIGTLSKALASIGGYAASTHEMQDYLYHKARPFLFSSSHPPSVIGTCMAALDILETDTERIKRLWDNSLFFKEGLSNMGFDIGASETPITPVILGNTPLAREFEERLFEEGIFALSITFPTVAKGKERLRTIVTSEHNEHDLTTALQAFHKIGRLLGVIKNNK